MEPSEETAERTTMPFKVETDYRLFDPQDYLREYYHAVDTENESLLRFFAEAAINNNWSGTKVLDFGCGPVIYPVISLARFCAEIHMSDYLYRNLQQVLWWIDGDHRAFDWNPFIRRALQLEAGLQSPHLVGLDQASYASTTSRAVDDRALAIKRKITRLVQGDVRQIHPLGIESCNVYDILISAFCLETAARDAEEWKGFVARISAMLKPGGVLLLVSVEDSVAYRVGHRYFSNVCINEGMLKETLSSCGYAVDSILVHRVKAQNPFWSKYQGFLMSSAQKAPRDNVSISLPAQE
jgi:2-polyprenyl-3-methyl-5-hydroxy-6-metoxy-1,4-benzoquinol methylase